jgi:uncharacterized membrane protein YdjX (TVP38/TMEM64 family)
MRPRQTDIVREPPAGLRRFVSNRDRPRAWIRIAFGVVAAALCLGWLVLPVGEWITAFQRSVLGLGAAGVAIFAGVFIAATLLLAPDWPLAIAAGMVYGLWAVLLILAAAIVAASLAFLVARYLLRQRVRAILTANRRFAAVDNAVTEEGWKIVVLLRLSPLVPFNVQNYLFGITDIPFRHYFAATSAGIVPGTVLFVYLGALGNASGGPLELGFFGLGLAATAVVVILVTRKVKAKLAESGLAELGLNNRGP